MVDWPGCVVGCAVVSVDVWNVLQRSVEQLENCQLVVVVVAFAVKFVNPQPNVRIGFSKPPLKVMSALMQPTPALFATSYAFANNW